MERLAFLLLLATGVVLANAALYGVYYDQATSHPRPALLSCEDPGSGVLCRGGSQ